jgi:polysaccharide transporter, PST family
MRATPLAKADVPWGNLMSIGALKGIDLILPLITLPYLVRVLGIDQFGLLSFAMAIGLYAGVLIQYGFGLTAVRDLARGRESHDHVSRVYGATMTASLGLVCIVVPLVFFLVLLLGDGKRLDLYFFTLLHVTLQALLPVWFFQGSEEMHHAAATSASGKVLMLAGMLVFVRDRDDLTVVPMVQAATCAMTLLALMALIRLRFGVRLMRPSLRELRQAYADGSSAFLHQFAPLLYNNSATFILGLSAPPKVLGIYAAAAKIIDAMTSLAYVMSAAFLPRLSRSLHGFASFKRLMLISGAMLSVACFVLARPIVAFAFPDGGSVLVDTLRFFSVNVFLGFAVLVFNATFLMVAKRESSAKRIALTTSLAGGAVVLFAIPIWGMPAAIAIIVLARFTMAGCGFVIYRRSKVERSK